MGATLIPVSPFRVCPWGSSCAGEEVVFLMGRVGVGTTTGCCGHQYHAPSPIMMQRRVVNASHRLLSHIKFTSYRPRILIVGQFCNGQPRNGEGRPHICIIHDHDGGNFVDFPRSPYPRAGRLSFSHSPCFPPGRGELLQPEPEMLYERVYLPGGLIL